MVPTRRKPVCRAYLDGNFARRRHPDWPMDYVIWDTELAGFGWRVRPSGTHVWFVRLRQRGRHRRIGLGRCKDVDALFARKMAQRCLAEAALDGRSRVTGLLGKRIKSVPRLALPDSRTGPKTVYLTSQALAVLNSMKRQENCPWVFPNRKQIAPLSLYNWWPHFRQQKILANPIALMRANRDIP
jgi:hypothetical protein